jgi:hypothetical protein
MLSLFLVGFNLEKNFLLSVQVSVRIDRRHVCNENLLHYYSIITAASCIYECALLLHLSIRAALPDVPCLLYSRGFAFPFEFYSHYPVAYPTHTPTISKKKKKMKEETHKTKQKKHFFKDEVEPTQLSIRQNNYISQLKHVKSQYIRRDFQCIRRIKDFLSILYIQDFLAHNF